MLLRSRAGPNVQSVPSVANKSASTRGLLCHGNHLRCVNSCKPHMKSLIPQLCQINHVERWYITRTDKVKLTEFCCWRLPKTKHRLVIEAKVVSIADTRRVDKFGELEHYKTCRSNQANLVTRPDTVRLPFRCREVRSSTVDKRRMK